MNNHPEDSKDTDNTGEKKGSGIERLARIINPPSREISDAELIDPGANAPEENPQHPTKKPPAVR